MPLKCTKFRPVCSVTSRKGSSAPAWVACVAGLAAWGPDVDSDESGDLQAVAVRRLAKARATSPDVPIRARKRRESKGWDLILLRNRAASKPWTTACLPTGRQRSIRVGNSKSVVKCFEVVAVTIHDHLAFDAQLGRQHAVFNTELFRQQLESTNPFVTFEALGIFFQLALE